MKFKNQIAIGVVCIVLGIIISMQYKLIQTNYLNGILPTTKQNDLINDLNSLKESKQAMTLELESARATLQEIEKAASKDNAVINHLTAVIKEYEILAGKTDVHGEGVVITVDNTPNDGSNAYQGQVVDNYRLILSLVNELNAAGAEAISVNDQRIVAITEIRVASGAINVNGITQKIPLVVKAIGKKSALEGAVTSVNGIVDELRRFQLLVDVRTLDDIDIPRFIGNINFQYVQTIDRN